MITDALSKAGLSGGEIKVYNTLLDLGLSPISKIHEKTGIERRNIYDILNKLIERGLVTYIIENKKRFFQVSHPSKIIRYLDEKELNIKKTKKEIEKLIPSVVKKFELKKPNINAEIYRGIEGVKAVWEDMLNYKENYWIGSGRYIPKAFPNFFMNWNRRRIKLKVKWFNICRHELKKELKPLQLEYVRFLPKEFSGNPAVICIYGNKVVNFILGKEFFAFVIESNELAENYRRYHKYLWDNVAKS